VLATSRPQNSVVDRTPTSEDTNVQQHTYEGAGKEEEGGVMVEIQRANPKIILHFKGKGLVTAEEVLLLRELKRKQRRREMQREKRREMKAGAEKRGVREIEESAEIFLSAVQAAWD
jgi:hypothetical protein